MKITHKQSSIALGRFEIPACKAKFTLSPVISRAVKIPSNTRWLAQLTVISALMAACQQNPQQATAQDVSPSPVAESQKKTKESGIEALLVQLLPTNSCSNILKNLKFAAENKLFTTEDFYTEASIKKLLGDQSEVRFQGEFGGTYADKSQYFEERAKQKKRKLHNLEVISRPGEGQLENDHLPCFGIGYFQHMLYQDKDRNNKPYQLITAYFTLGLTAMGKATHNTDIDQLTASFGPPEETLPVLGERHPRLPNGEIIKVEEVLKRLFYQSQKGNYKYFMYATANKVGTILTIRIETFLEE